MLLSKSVSWDCGAKQKKAFQCGTYPGLNRAALEISISPFQSTERADSTLFYLQEYIVQR